MRKLFLTTVLLLAAGGCADSDLMMGSPGGKTNGPETPSQVAADQATADPSLNTINTEGTHSTGRSPGGWIDSTAGDGRSP